MCWHKIIANTFASPCDLREEDFEEFSNKAVAKERGLVHLADGSQEATLAVHAKGEQVVLHILETLILCKIHYPLLIVCK